MAEKKFEDILSVVQKPSRYLGTEVNRVLKKTDAVKLKMALAFPDLYDIGTSHFGLQILYNLLNAQDTILAERVFAPAEDFEAQLRHHNLALPSLEMRRPLGQFDIIGFSLLYELNFTNVINMIDMGQIPLRWKERTSAHPIIVAGGPSVCNPEPMADFFDAMVFGDGEGVTLEMARAWIAWKDEGHTDRNKLLEMWADIEGVYIPRFFQTRYDGDGFQYLETPENIKSSVTRAVVPDLDTACFPDRPIIPFGKPIHDRLRLEISRGCTRGCRFCQAGMIYRPVRERSPDTILALIEKALANTGYEDLSLLSLSTGDYTCLAPLMEKVMQLCRQDRIAVSLPSLRAGSLTPELMELIRSVRKTGFTIAPEAGSQRLRDVINKNITYEDVEATVKDAFGLGWQIIKLYFMIGLPTETDEDLDAIIDMVKKLKKIKGPQHQKSRRKGKINVSITTFVPKPHTPFQWAPQMSLAESRRKIQYLKQGLKIPGVYIKWQKPEMSVLEGLLARGDRRMGGLIEQAWKNGCTFDGWNDQFKFDLWEQAITQSDIDPGFFTTRSRELDEPLPWQHMDVKTDPDFFKSQWQAALQKEVVDDCRHGKCHNCGVCDFRTIEPKTFKTCKSIDTQPCTPSPSEKDAFVWISLKYTKLGDARLFGHLELSHIFSRAIRRADIRVDYSKGFHPMPKISFDDPLPLGIESEAEFMRILVSTSHICDNIVQRLNPHLPDGVQLIDCKLRSEAKKESRRRIQRFKIHFNDRTFDPGILDSFHRSASWPYVRTNHKGRVHEMDLRRVIDDIVARDDRILIYDIAPTSPFTIRPADIVKGIFEMSTDVLQAARILKLDPYPAKTKSTVDN